MSRLLLKSVPLQSSHSYATGSRLRQLAAWWKTQRSEDRFSSLLSLHCTFVFCDCCTDLHCVFRTRFCPDDVATFAVASHISSETDHVTETGSDWEFLQEVIMAAASYSPASLRNFSFTSAEQSLHVLMATWILSPVCNTRTHTHTCITFNI